MSAGIKFLIGLVAVIVMGWINHGPLGAGEALIGRLEAQAKSAVAATEVPGIDVRFERNPLSREAIMSGQANDLQREGLGGQKGLNDIVGEIEGVSGVRWTDPSTAAAGK